MLRHKTTLRRVKGAPNSDAPGQGNDDGHTVPDPPDALEAKGKHESDPAADVPDASQRPDLTEWIVVMATLLLIAILLYCLGREAQRNPDRKLPPTVQSPY